MQTTSVCKYYGECNEIGKDAFAECDALEQLEISEKNKRFVLENGMIKDRTGKNGDVKIGGPLEYCY